MKILKLTAVCLSILSIAAIAAIFLIERNDNSMLTAAISLTDELSKLEEYSEFSLSLVDPVEVVSMTLFADGGSIEVTFKDSSENRLDLFYDQSGEYPKENRHIYFGRYTEYEKARKVPIGSNVEKEALKYVSDWMGERFPDYRSNPDTLITFPETGRIINYGAIAAFVRDLEQRNAQK